MVLFISGEKWRKSNKLHCSVTLPYLNYGLLLLGKCNTVRPLLKKMPQRCETYKPTNCCIRLKKINAMSQSSWQIGRPDLNAFFFLAGFCLFVCLFVFSEQQTCQIWVVHSFEIWNLILDEQDIRQNTELNKSVFQSVSLCLSYLFLYILTSKFVKNWGKIKQAKKIQTLNFASNAHRKTNARGRFET